MAQDRCPAAFPQRFRNATLTLATAVIIIAGVIAVHANEKVCRAQEQRYEQIEKLASSIEINSALFSAADKGCVELAARLLDIGASLQARDRLGFTPLSRAAVSGQAEIVTLFLDRGAAIDERSIDGSTALYLSLIHI